MTTERAKPTTGDAYPSLPDAELIERLRERASIRSDTDAHLMIEAAARLSERRGDWQGIPDTRYEVIVAENGQYILRRKLGGSCWSFLATLESTTQEREFFKAWMTAINKNLPESPHV